MYDDSHLRSLSIKEAKSHFFWSSKPAQQMEFLEQTTKSSSVLIVRSFVESRSTEWKKQGAQMPSFWHLKALRSEKDFDIWNDIKVSQPRVFNDQTFSIQAPGVERYQKCEDCIGTGSNKCSDCKGRGYKECKNYDEEMDRCKNCSNKKCKYGVKPCSTCGKEGLKSCKSCNSYGFIKFSYTVKVEFKTIKQVYAHDSFPLLPFSCLENAHGVVKYRSNSSSNTITIESFSDVGKINEMAESFLKNQRFKTKNNNYRPIGEEVKITTVPVTEVQYKWKKHKDFLYVYGEQDLTYFNEYPITCCFC